MRLCQTKMLKNYKLMRIQNLLNVYKRLLKKNEESNVKNRQLLQKQLNSVDEYTTLLNILIHKKHQEEETC